jgi:hypothetical protein
MSSKRPVSTSSVREQSYRRYPASPAICMYVIRHTLPGMRRGRILSTGSTDITYSNMVGRNGMHRSIPDLDTEIDQDLGAPISACTRTDNCREKSRKHCFSGNHKGAKYISQMRASGHAIVAGKEVVFRMQCILAFGGLEQEVFSAYGRCSHSLALRADVMWRAQWLNHQTVAKGANQTRLKRS